MSRLTKTLWWVVALLVLVLIMGKPADSAINHQQKKILKKNLQESKNTIRWFESRKHRWRLHPRFETCQNVARLFSSKRGDVCYVSRQSYRAHKARKSRIEALLYPLPPHYNSWLCIYSHEKGADGWATNTGNGYYGGLQMDLSFQGTYGGHLLRTKGTANNWTMLEQMWVAEEAYKTRGFYPWPNTARACGLI